MKTQEQILTRINHLKDEDIFGFETGTLMDFLTFENAKPFLKPTATKEDWDKQMRPLSQNVILKQMEDYMPFAWDKANNFRGISASRSISHYKAWLWLLGDDSIDTDEYEFYGKDILARICKKYGWDSKQWDDGVRLNEEP